MPINKLDNVVFICLREFVTDGGLRSKKHVMKEQLASRFAGIDELDFLFCLRFSKTNCTSHQNFRTERDLKWRWGERRVVDRVSKSAGEVFGFSNLLIYSLS